MRLCVIGNSHGAALKRALAVDDNAAKVLIDFFAMPGGLGPHIRADGNRLFPAAEMKDKVYTTIPGAAAGGLDLGPVEAVMFCAAGLAAHRNGDPDHIFNKLALASLVQAPGANRKAVSEAVMASEIESVLRASANLQAIQVIRSVFSGPLIIQICPLPTRALAAYRPEGDKGSNLANQYGDRVWSFLSWYYRQQVGIINAYADTLNARVISLEDSFVEAGFTPSKYGGPDPWHMNTAYGRLTLKQALIALSLLQH